MQYHSDTRRFLSLNYNELHHMTMHIARPAGGREQATDFLHDFCLRSLKYDMMSKADKSRYGQYVWSSLSYSIRISYAKLNRKKTVGGEKVDVTYQELTSDVSALVYKDKKDILDRVADADEARRAVRRAEGTEYAVLKMIYKHDMTPKEMGYALGLTHSAVYMASYRILEKARRYACDS